MSDAGKKVTLVDPSTGKAADLSPHEAQEQFVAGKGQLPVGVPVALVSPHGEVMQFDPDKVQGAMMQGWSMADRSQVLAETAKTQPVRASLEGAAAGLTGGASDLAAIHMFGAEAEGVAARRATPAGEVSEMLGTGVTVLGSLGVGGAVKAGTAAATQAAERSLAGTVASKLAGAALAPTRALTVMGDAAAAAATSGASRLGASAVASRIAGQMIGRGLEGATVGAIGAMAEESLGDPNANAAQLLAAGGMGALVGGGFGAAAGGAFQGLSEGLGRLARGKASVVAADEASVTKALQDAGIGNPDKGLVRKFTDGAVDMAKRAAKRAYDAGNEAAVKAGFNADDIALANDDVFQAFYREGEKGIVEAADKLGSVIDDVAKHSKAAEHHLPARPSVTTLAERLPAEAVTDAVDVAGRHVDEFRTALRDLTDNEVQLGLGAGGVKRVLGKAQQSLDDLETRVFKMAGVEKEYRGTVMSADALGTAVESQVTKRRGLREVAGLFELPPEAAAEAFSALSHVADNLRLVKSTNPTVKTQVTDLLRSLDDTLGNTKIWGETADTVKRLNDARQMRDEAFSMLKGKLKFSEAGTVDRASLASYMRNVTSMEGDDAAAVGAVQKWISAQQEILSSTEKLVGDPGKLASEVAAIGSASKLASKFEVAHQAVSERVAAFNVLDRLTRARQDMLGVGVGPLGYAAQGAAHTAVSALAGMTGIPGLGTLAHMGVAVASQAAMDPARAAMIRANSGAAIEKARAGFGAAVGKVLGLPAKALPNTGPRVANLARGTTALLNASTDAERRKAFRERLAEVAEMNSVQHTLARNRRVMAIGDHMPNTAAAMDAKASLAAQLLLASVPAPRLTPGGLQYREPEYSQDAIRRFARIDRAVQDPNGILERAAEGDISREDVMVWNTLYPELKAAAQSIVANELANGHELTRRQEEMLLRLTGDSSGVRGAHLRRLQAIHTAKPPARASQPSAAQSARAASANMSAADKLQ